MTAAIPVTTRRFGPSGSWKNANIILEHATAVIARISKELFLKLICMRVWRRLRMIRSYRSRGYRTNANFEDERPLWGVRRGRRRFPVGASPTRQPLQPEATGAVMEATKWLKPLVSVSRIGDGASGQALTRRN